MTELRALLWDVDGTLAETERDGHRVAFNRAFEALQLPWRWSEEHYGGLLAVTGGRERLLHDMAKRGDAPVGAGERVRLAAELHRMKNRLYAEIVATGALPLRPGVAELVEQARAAGLLQAIVTTTSRDNVDALLGRHFGPRWREVFVLQVCGEDVARKKPDPQAYEQALLALRLSPLQALAIEDSPGGVASARDAGVPVIVPRSAYFATAPIEGARAVGDGLDRRGSWLPALEPTTQADAPADPGRVALADLLAWRSRAEILWSCV